MPYRMFTSISVLYKCFLLTYLAKVSICFLIADKAIRYVIYEQEGQRCPKRRVAQAAIRLATAVTRNRTHLWPDAGCIHRQRPTNIV